VPQNSSYSNDQFTATYAIEDYTINNWADVGVWSQTGATVNVKRITVRVRSTAQNLQGRRELVVSALKVVGN
jgi:hypothetical protein